MGCRCYEPATLKPLTLNCTGAEFKVERLARAFWAIWIYVAVKVLSAWSIQDLAYSSLRRSGFLRFRVHSFGGSSRFELSFQYTKASPAKGATFPAAERFGV